MTNRRRSPRHWILAAEATVLLAAFRVAILVLPTARLQRLFGATMAETPQTPLDDIQRDAVRSVRWAVLGISNLTPWKADCLPQALTAKHMLRRRGLASTMYVGAAFTARRDALTAHAWLRCGTFAVTGGRDNDRHFGAIASYV